MDEKIKEKWMAKPDYVSASALRASLAGIAVCAISITGLCFSYISLTLYSFFVAFGLMLQWTLIRQVYPVAYRVWVLGESLEQQRLSSDSLSNKRK